MDIQNQLIEFNTSINKLSGLDDYHLVYQELFGYNFNLRLPFDSLELVKVIDRIITPITTGKRNLKEFGLSVIRTINPFSSVEGWREDEAVDDPDPLFDLSFSELEKLLLDLTPNQRLFILLHVYKTREKRLNTLQASNDTFLSTYKLVQNIYRSSLESYISEFDDKFGQDALQVFDIRFQKKGSIQNEGAEIGTKVQYKEFMFSLYSLLRCQGIEYRKNRRSGVNAYHLLSELGNYVIDNINDLNKTELIQLIDRFPNASRQTKIANSIIKLYNTSNVPSSNITIATVQSYYNDGFGLISNIAMNVPPNELIIKKLLSQYPDLERRIIDFGVNTKEFLSKK